MLTQHPTHGTTVHVIKKNMPDERDVVPMMIFVPPGAAPDPLWGQRYQANLLKLDGAYEPIPRMISAVDAFDSPEEATRELSLRQEIVAMTLKIRSLERAVKEAEDRAYALKYEAENRVYLVDDVGRVVRECPACAADFTDARSVVLHHADVYETWHTVTQLDANGVMRERDAVDASLTCNVCNANLDCFDVDAVKEQDIKRRKIPKRPRPLKRRPTARSAKKNVTPLTSAKCSPRY